MDNSRQPLTRLKTSESGTRPKVKTSTQPAALLDDEFHAFFDRGDVGDYEGGLAYTQPPASIDPVTTDESRVIRTSEQKARRALFTKVVTIVVVCCASLLLVAMGFKSRSDRNEAKNIEKQYDSLPSVARSEIGSRVAHQVPGQPASENLQLVAPPPAPQDIPIPATVANSDSANSDKPDPDLQIPPVPAKVPTAPTKDDRTVKNSSPNAPVVQTKHVAGRGTADERLSTPRIRQRSVSKVAATSVPRPVPKERPSVAAFPVE